MQVKYGRSSLDDIGVFSTIYPWSSKGKALTAHRPWISFNSPGINVIEAFNASESSLSLDASLLSKQAQQMPSSDPQDPAFRRLRYVRYVDDCLLGFIDSREEAEIIKRQIKEFLLHELDLELSVEKTLITHAYTEAARFLGYEISTLL